MDWDNYTAVLAAVRNDGLVLQYASNRLRDTNDTVLEAVRNEGFALQFASDRLRNDRGVVLAAVNKDGFALMFASMQCRSDRGIVFAAITNTTTTTENKKVILKFASDLLRHDKWFNCVTGKKLKLLVHLQIKYTRQDRLYQSWLHPKSVHIQNYSETYDESCIPGVPLFLASVLKNRNLM